MWARGLYMAGFRQRTTFCRATGHAESSIVINRFLSRHDNGSSSPSGGGEMATYTSTGRTMAYWTVRLLRATQRTCFTSSKHDTNGGPTVAVLGGAPKKHASSAAGHGRHAFL
jgi:hypothetical protein